MTYLTIFLLFFLPLIVIPFGISYFETPKVILAEIAIELMLFLVLLKGRFNLEKVQRNFLLLTGLIFALTIIDLVIFGFDNKLFGNAFRLQGVFLLWHLLIFSLLSSLQRIKIPQLLPILSLAGLTLSVFIFGNNQAGRIVGSLGEPNSLAATVLFMSSFLYTGKRAIKLAALVSVLIIIFLSGSKSALLALALQLFLLYFNQILKLSLSKSVIICLVLLALSLNLPLIEGRSLFEDRAETWQTALYSGLQSPIIGHGFGNIENSFKQSSIILNNNIQYEVVDSSHNFLLDFWVQGGLVGLTVIVSLLYLSLRNLVTTSNITLLLSFISVLTMMLFNPVSVVILLAFWWLIGQGFSIDKRTMHAT